MPKELKEQDEVVIEHEKPEKEIEKPGVEVDLDAKPEKKEEPQYVKLEELQKLQKQFNGISSTIRQIKDIPSKIESLEKVLNSRFATASEKKEAKDELDEMLEKGDWRTPVKQLAQKEFQEMMARQQAEWSELQARSVKMSTLEKSKQTVRERYPDIDDPDSEISRKYQKVLAENPQYLQNEFGPTLAMRDMEDELRQEGRLDEFSKKIVEKEIIRQTRAGIGAVPKNNVQTSGNKIVLTKEQKDFCDANDIKYQDYAKFLRGNSREGVSV